MTLILKRAGLCAGLLTVTFLAPAQQRTAVSVPATRVAAAAAAQTAVAPEATDPNPYKLTWLGRETQIDSLGRRYALPAFTGMVTRRGVRLPLVEVRVEGRVTAFTLLQPRYEPLPAADGALLDVARVGTAPTFRWQTGTERGQSLTLVQFAPIRRSATTGGLERLVSYDYTATVEQGTAHRGGGGSSPHAAASVLAQGRWVKIGVPASGIYRLDRTAVRDLGLDPATFDARNLQLWGNGGLMLPQPLATARPDDLVENAVLVDETNGSLNALTFYAQGPHGWSYNASAQRFVHNENLYSDSSYYFLTVGSRAGLRVVTETAPGPATAPPITTFNEHVYHELNRTNLLLSGREWMGEEFNSLALTQTFPFDLPGLVSDGTVCLTASTVANLPQVSGPAFRFTINGSAVGTQNVTAITTNYYPPAGSSALKTFCASLATVGASSPLQVGVAFETQGAAASRGWLNYLEINVPRTLQLYGSQTTFRATSSVAAGRLSEFSIGNCPATAEVWDVTDPLHPRRQSLGAPDASGARAFVAATDSLREFVVFNQVSNGGVRSFGVVPPQNLHALNLGATGGADQLDLVIVTHPDFLSQANRLAEHRRQHDGLQVAVATTTQVFNEFSSGRQDVTAIRDLMKMVYDRAQDVTNYPLHLLLLGDASYDYKSNKWYGQRAGSPTAPTPDNTNFVPVYESFEYLDQINTFSSEDYFGLLDDNEGRWLENSSGELELVDIGIGRLPAHDEATATTLVDKLLHYDATASFGKWRNRLAYASDDDEPSFTVASCEPLINTVAAQRPAFNYRKNYLDLYPQVTVPSGQRSPACSAALDETIEQGTVLLTYAGHGGETGWTAERILDVTQVNNWRNYDRLTFMLTATCEFGRYDDPRRSSAAEYALYNSQGGAMGLMTTTRPVYQHNNDALSRGFYEGMLTPINGQPSRLGDIYRRAKTSGSANGSRNFALLGDPSARLAIPRGQAALTTINGHAPMASDTLQALSTVELAGTVLTPGGQLDAAFTGRIQVTVYAQAVMTRSLGNEAASFTVAIRENILYDGVATVKDGQWRTRFVVPRDINYAYGAGKISLYAWTADRDAAGANGSTIVIGGSNPNAPTDTTPPAIRLFMDDMSFVGGGLTGTEATLLATLRDTSGINTAGTGIGHEITAYLDGQRDNVLVLNPYYTADVDSYTAGKVKYLFKGLTPGPHTVTLKAWDTFNNSAETSLDFVVGNDDDLTIDHVLNYPNPFGNHTTFHFDHNRAGDDLDVQIQVFTVTGRLVRTIQSRATGAPAHVGDLAWDGRDEFGDVLARGVYVYKVNVRSERDGAHKNKFEKLVILN